MPPDPQNGGIALEESEAATAATSTAVPSPETASASNVDGTWGERDVGGPVSHRMAMEDFEAMRRELTNLSQTPSKPSTKGDGPGLLRRVTSRKSDRAEHTRTQSSGGFLGDREDLEAGDAERAAEKEEEFELGTFTKEGHFEKRTEEGESAKKVGVVFRNLTVKGAGSTMTHTKTLPDAILGTFGPDLYNIICTFVPALAFRNQLQLRTLINDFTGIVRDGEMMLVLGRPGSGCTSFLKAIANKRGEYAAIEGDISYGGITAKEQHEKYQGEVNYNPEDDQVRLFINDFSCLFAPR